MRAACISSLVSRGSGKSSLYTTLRYITDRSTDAKERPDPEYSTYISELEQIRWLDPLDLEVAVDEEENLLAAVLVRIFAAIDDAIDEPGNYSPLSASKDCRDAMAQLEELANDIGIAWEGNLKARAGALDPDSYSQETIRAQRTRLKTNRRLRLALNALFRGKGCYGLSGKVLFVLPIDDFYLKPKASLELLRLLRMISVPRLFFLIMGDIKTVEALFFEKALADWTAVAGSQVFGTLLDRSTQEVLPRAREMRARYLRKLIPESQRAIINWTEWDEALRFKPLGSELKGNSRSSAKPLQELLLSFSIRWKADQEKEKCNLLNYLVSPLLDRDDPCKTLDQDNKERNTLKGFREAYSGLQILDASPRELLDLWMLLQKQNNEKTDSNEETRLRALVDYAVPVMEEQDFLREEDQEVLRFVFPSGTRDDLQLDTEKFRVKQKPTPWLPPENDKNVRVRDHLDWRFSIRNSEPQECKCQNGRQENALRETGPARIEPLRPRQAAWIILLHDLVWNWRSSSIMENLVGKLRTEIGKSPGGKDFGTKRPGWAWYMVKENGKDQNGEKQNDWVHFPLPAVCTFRQLDRFLAIWTRVPSANGRNTSAPPGNSRQPSKSGRWLPGSPRKVRRTTTGST